MPLARELGIEIVEADFDVVTVVLEWAPELCAADGFLHRGALLTLIDSCAGVLAYLNLPDGSTAAATVETKTNFILKGIRGGVVTATATPLHMSTSVMVIETEAQVQGELVAKATQTEVFVYPGYGATAWQ